MASIKKYNGSTFVDAAIRKYSTASEIITPPTTIYADGSNATVNLKGNTVQNGTPTPSNPVDVVGVGTLDSGQYKIPISSANTTTPVYLGEVQTTRKIKKLVLTGEEEYAQYGGATGVGIRLTVEDMRIPSSVAQRTEGYCTHFVPTSAPSSATGDNITFGTNSNMIYIILSVASQQALNVSTYDEVKAWIAAQYANGTPVTVWYVLATETTGIVNEPLRKIGNYADTVSGITIPTITGKDTVDVETTLKPSEVELTYTGWHDASVKEKSRNLFDEVYPSIAASIKYKSIYVGEGEFTGTSDVPVINNKSSIWLLEGQASSGATGNNSITNDTKTVTSIDGYVTIAYRNTESSIDFSQYHVMLNEGSTALPYEPYWK